MTPFILVAHFHDSSKQSLFPFSSARAVTTRIDKWRQRATTWANIRRRRHWQRNVTQPIGERVYLQLLHSVYSQTIDDVWCNWQRPEGLHRCGARYERSLRADIYVTFAEYTFISDTNRLMSTRGPVKATTTPLPPSLTDNDYGYRPPGVGKRQFSVQNCDSQLQMSCRVMCFCIATS